MRRRRFAPSVVEMPGAVYSPFGDLILEQGVPPVALHVGDTWLPACPGTRRVWGVGQRAPRAMNALNFRATPSRDAYSA